MKNIGSGILQTFVNNAKLQSPYYQKLYHNIDKVEKLEDLPITDSNQYSKEHHTFENKNLPFMSGICLRTSGTTNLPKVSFWSKRDWEKFCQGFAEFYTKNKIIQQGDKVANLYLCGNLSGSLLLNHDIFHHLECIEFPVASHISVELTAEVLGQICPQIIMGGTLHLVKLASYLHLHNIKLTSVNKILYGAEGMYLGQYLFLKKVFTRATIMSAGYASTDAGLLGFCDNHCDINEFITTDQTIIEIVHKKTFLPITKTEEEGIILATNLSKLNTPLIRYPVGDLGYWTKISTDKVSFKLSARNRPYETEKIFLSTGEEVNPNIAHDLMIRHSYKEIITGIQLNIERIKDDHDKLKLLIAIEESQETNTLELIKENTIHILRDIINTIDFYKKADKIEVKFCKFINLNFDDKTLKFQGIVIHDNNRKIL